MANACALDFKEEIMDDREQLLIWKRKLFVAELEGTRAVADEVMRKIVRYHRARLARRSRFVLQCESIIQQGEEQS